MNTRHSGDTDKQLNSKKKVQITSSKDIAGNWNIAHTMVSRFAAVLAIFIGIVVCLDAFHIGVGKISTRRKRPRRTLLVSVLKLNSNLISFKMASSIFFYICL